MTATNTDDTAQEWTATEVQAVIERVAGGIMELGTVDWVALTKADESPMNALARCESLVTCTGFLASLIPQVNAPVSLFFQGMNEAIAEGMAPPPPAT